MERQQLLPGDDEPGSNPGVLPDISSFRVCTDIFRKWVQIDGKKSSTQSIFLEKRKLFRQNLIHRVRAKEENPQM